MTDSRRVSDLFSDELHDSMFKFSDTDITMGPVISPPIPLKHAWDLGGEEYGSRLFVLCDLAKAAWHVGDPILGERGEWDEETEDYVNMDTVHYPIKTDSVRELSAANAVIFGVYKRELKRLAEDLGVADNPEYEDETQEYDYRKAIQDYFGYERPDHGFDRPIERISDDLGVDETEVMDALRDKFGDDVDQFEWDSSEFSTSSLEEVREALIEED